MKKTVLFIQSDKISFSQISDYITKHNLAVSECRSDDLISACTDLQPDTIITESIEIIKEIRSWSDIPVIIISANTSENRIISAFDAGADEYIHESESGNIILARIKNVLCHKRISSNTTDNYICDNLEINFEKRTIFVKGKEIHLTPIEYSIVELLCQNRGSVVTYEYILKKIWGPFISSDNKILRVNMTNIRKKIEDDPANPIYLKTENGIGYSIRV